MKPDPFPFLTHPPPPYLCLFRSRPAQQPEENPYTNLFRAKSTIRAKAMGGKKQKLQKASAEVVRTLLLDPPPAPKHSWGRWVTLEEAVRLGIFKSVGVYVCRHHADVQQWTSGHAMPKHGQACRLCCKTHQKSPWRFMCSPAIVWFNVPRHECPDTYTGRPKKHRAPRSSALVLSSGVSFDEEAPEKLDASHPCWLCSYCRSFESGPDRPKSKAGCCTGVGYLARPLPGALRDVCCSTDVSGASSDSD